MGFWPVCLEPQHREQAPGLSRSRGFAGGSGVKSGDRSAGPSWANNSPFPSDVGVVHFPVLRKTRENHFVPIAKGSSERSPNVVENTTLHSGSLGSRVDEERS